jgi:hypothetical protein
VKALAHFLVALAALVPTAPASAQVDQTNTFEEKVLVLTAFFDAAKRGDQQALGSLIASDAEAQVGRKAVTLTVESFKEFSEACILDRQRTVAYDELKGAHFLYNCHGAAFNGGWAVNAWIDQGKVKYLSAFWTPGA